MLPINSIGSLLIIVETPSKSRKPVEEPFIRVLTPVELMDSNYINSLPQSPTSADSGAEPGVEILKGAASLSPQQLPTVHNLVPAATPVFNSYRSMFQGWKNSVPKLYKYPASEIEVVVYRKNGQIGKLSNGDGGDTEKKSGFKEANASSSVESSPEEPYKNVSHLMKNISKPLVITPEPGLGSSLSLLPEECKYEGDIGSSPSPTSLPHFPVHFNQQLGSENAKKMFTITPVAPEVFPGTQNTSYRSYVPTVLSAGDEIKTNSAFYLSDRPQQFGQASAFVKPQVIPTGKGEKRRRVNCHFTFGFSLAPLKRKEADPFVDNVINVENLLEDSDAVAKTLKLAEWPQRNHMERDVQHRLVQTDIKPLINVDQSIQSTPTVNYASNQTEELKMIMQIGDHKRNTSSMAVQTEPETRKPVTEIGVQYAPSTSYQGSQTEAVLEPEKPVMMEFSCQNAPITTIQESQTHPQPVTEVGVQNAPITSYQESQTDPEPKKPMMIEVGCQNAPITSYQQCQTEPEPQKVVVDVGCQQVPSVSYQESQTETNVSKNATCQTVYDQQSEGTQTHLEVTHAECQVSPTYLPQSNQTEQDILNPVTHCECQAVVEMESKLSQSVTETTEIASQCTPTYESKEIQLSGSCCYFREKRIRKIYDKAMREIVRKAKAELKEKTLALNGEKSAEVVDQKETITDEDVDLLVNKFNYNFTEVEKSREELRSQVEGLTQQITWSRNSLETTQTTDYFEDDILESSTA